MLTNVQVVPGERSVARFEDVVVWFETGPEGGGVVLPQLLQAVQSVSTGAVPPRQMGARLAAVLTTGDAEAVPALVAATPEEDGLRVVVHGWGAVVTDGIHVPNGWVDEVISDRRTFFVGRNTVTPQPPVEDSTLDLEDGLVAGDGVSFALSPSLAPPAAARSGPGRVGAPEPGDAPVAAPPPPGDAVRPVEPPGSERPPGDPPPPPASVGSPPATAGSTGGPAGPSPPPWPLPGTGPEVERDPPPTAAELQAPTLGRLVLDDGSTAVLERTCVLGSAPDGSPAVQTGVAIPLTVAGAGIAAVHVEVRVDDGRVAIRDLGAAATFVLPPRSPSWIPLAPGQVSPLTPGTRVALGQRTFAYERP